MKYEKLSKRAMIRIFISDLIEIIIKYIILMFILDFTLKDFPQITSIILDIVILKDILYLIIVPKIKYDMYTYSITEDSIKIKEGFLFVEINVVPIERIHKFIIKKGPIDKLLKLSKVILTTSGGDVTIKYLSDDRVKDISTLLNNKINEIAKETNLNSESSV